MKDKIVSFETAKLAKKKGFDLIQTYCNEYSLYTKEGEHTYYANYGFMHSGISEGYISAPTQSFLQKWLRKYHKIQINIDCILTGDDDEIINEGYIVVVYNNWRQKVEFELSLLQSDVQTVIHKKYEKALEEGLTKALKMIKK